MKLRKGFVSNSSSSSFIIGVAKVVDSDEIHRLAKKHGIHDYCLNIKLATEDNGWGRYYEDGTFSIESFTGSTESIKAQPDDLVLDFHYYGNEGDNFFFDEDYTYPDYDYDMDFDKMFDDNMKAFIEDLSNTDALKGWTWHYGAGRDG